MLLKTSDLETVMKAMAEAEARLTQQFLFEKNRILYFLQLHMLAQHINVETFGKYKGCFAGKDVVVLGTGSSLDSFKPIDNAIYIGVQGAFKYNKVKLDFLFVQDYRYMHEYCDGLQDSTVIKFYGLLPGNPVPESVTLRHKANRYVLDSLAHPLSRKDMECVYDIAYQPVSNFGSCIFAAMQFALYCNPHRIFIVGCDTNNIGHFKAQDLRGAWPDGSLERILAGWKKIKEFADIYYPETEIISINPVGLKGLFKDIYD